MKHRFISVLCTVLIIFCMPLSGCQAEQPFSKTEYLLNTTCTISIYGTRDESLLDGTFSLVRQYEGLFSKTLENSDISRINRAEGTPTAVDPATAELIQTALNYSAKTNGKFDITIGRVSDLWDFTAEPPSLPSPEALDAALPTVNWKQVKVDGNTVTVPSGTQLDLGGIAKGYIADRAAEYLRANGISRGILNLGGNIYALGGKSGTEPWKVGIQRPFADRNEIIGSVSVRDCSVVTSGLYERFFELDGTLYHHILDPQTGYPVSNGMESVTILSKSSAMADALSTSAFLLGVEEAKTLIESLPDTEAVFVLSDGTVQKTSGIGTDIPFLPANG